jgi:hypothetical protein
MMAVEWSIPEGPLRALVEELYRLRGRAGRPTFREIERDLVKFEAKRRVDEEDSEAKLRYAAIRDLFRKDRQVTPKLPDLLRVVAYLASRAPHTDEDKILDRFDELWTEADAYFGD